jgi:outer membrane biosynthesis protein TonB
MKQNTVNSLRHVIAVCALLAGGFTILQSAAMAQTSQDNQAEKTTKTKKSKKAVTDATSSQPTAPATEEKATKAKKSKKVAADATSSQPVPPAAGEQTPATKKSKKSATDATSSGSAQRAQTSADKQPAAAPAQNASAGEIQSAKSGGKVWVNTESGVYHKGGRWYGATKQGKFMTEQDAIKAGYKSAKNEK